MKGVSVLNKERLTERDEYGNADIIGVDAVDLQGNLLYEEMNRVTFAINKLAEYEDLEEQDLLLRLPCKVGDKAWYVHKGGIDEVEVDSFVLNVNLFVNVSLYIGCDRFGKTLTPYKTLFFTQSEAEEKLRELEGK